MEHGEDRSGAGASGGEHVPPLPPPGPGRFPITQLRRDLQRCGFSLLYSERRSAAEGREEELLASVSRRLVRRILLALVCLPLFAGLVPTGSHGPSRLVSWVVSVGVLAWQSWGLWRVRRARRPGLDGLDAVAPESPSSE